MTEREESTYRSEAPDHEQAFVAAIRELNDDQFREFLRRVAEIEGLAKPPKHDPAPQA